jgi:hypothetical protein
LELASVIDKVLAEMRNGLVVRSYIIKHKFFGTCKGAGR